MTVIGDILGVRHLQVFLASTAIALAYLLRINMSVAVVAMTNKNNANPDYPQFDWSEEEKGYILSTFFWGYLILQIFLGNMAEKFGAKMILALAMAICSVLTIIIPLLASSGYLVVCVLRVLQGAAQGSFFPCVTVLISKWATPVERGRAMTVALSGSNIGTLVGLSLSGFLASSRYGWPSIFYVTGGFGIIWTVLWLWVGASSPSEHKSISNEEKTYIETALNTLRTSEKKLETPWKKIVTSVPLWAIFIAHLGQNWGYWTLLTQMPNYISSVLKVNIKDNGILSSLPYLCGWGAAILFSWIGDYVNKKQCVSKTVQRKLWNSLGLGGPALALFVLGVAMSANEAFVITLLIITVSLNAGVFNGFLTNHADLSPNFCGTLMGITNSLANITSILGPLCVSWILPGNNAPEAIITGWKYVFLLSGAIMFGANLVYIIFSSSEVQPWDDSTPKKNYGSAGSTSAETGE